MSVAYAEKALVIYKSIIVFVQNYFSCSVNLYLTLVILREFFFLTQKYGVIMNFLDQSRKKFLTTTINLKYHVLKRMKTF